ncbi:MAG TPA: ATP-binding protein [Gemmatimonadaceae bacterium]|nr:ATP-binding protein [Gemmatimonadaceae bacterium]
MSYTTRLLTQSLLAIVAFLVAAVFLDPWRSIPRLLATTAAALLASWLIARTNGTRTTRTVRQLRDAADALAAGDLSVRPALASPGELGELSDALRRVAEQLGARIEALQAEDALLGAVIESLNEGVLTFNAREQVVRINRVGRELLQIGEEPLPVHLDRLPRDAPLHRAVQAALRGTSTAPLEAAIGDRTLALTATPLLGGGGGAVVALFDLTQVRRLEQIRRDFVANVSHELRTPLTVVSGFAETLAEDDPEPAERRQFAEMIRTHTLRMQRIVDDLLDLSRIESGGWVPKPEKVDVRALAEEALAAAAPVAESKGIALTLEIGDEVGPITVDRTAVRQILSNLIDNSLRHTDSGQVTVFATSDAEGTRIGVRDTGSGIAPEHLPRIFERFYRADPARARESGGTGLGLSIVKHLVDAHGGTVRAASQPGRGTTITALLP